MLTCPVCVARNPEAARFCNQCGARLEDAPVAAPGYTPRHLVEKVLSNRAALQGERKRVTVLFADVKGSTRLAQEVGPEAWHAILDRFFSILSTAVHRYEGTVNQYTGDGIMALFGAPVAHEDHASRACFAALEMQREIRRLADDLRLKKGLNLSMRVGLNTGEVIVGRIGDDLRMDYTAQGLTVNLAARMEHICEPGRVYLTRHTARQVEGYFQLRELGPMQVDGVDQPVEVYELEGAGVGRTRLDLTLARSGSPFVGRERELGCLLGALERVREGDGQIVAVIGNAGIGKSRLCHEFARACAAAGIAVHRATGVPYHNAVPMYPIRMLARSRLGLAENANPDDVRRLVAGTFLMNNPGDAPLLPAVFDFLGVGTGELMTPEQAAQARPRVMGLFAEYLCCRKKSQVLLIEDLHFLDSGSEEFIRMLCERVRGTRTLLLLNYRPDYISEELLPHLDEQVMISALNAEQIERLAANLLGDHPSVRPLPQLLRNRASGNPFFVEEAVQALADSGHLEGERGAYRLLRPVEQWTVPDTVHALLAARMDRLPEAPRTLLQTAAVIGQEFAAALLGVLAGAPATALEEQLQLLEDSGFVHQAKVTEYRFCHPLMQEVAYQTQLESRRAAVHARLAAELEAAQPANEATEAAVRIAHHWRCAGDRARAGSWELQAARWAGPRDMSTALEHFRLAMEQLDAAPDDDAVRRNRVSARAGVIRMAQFVPVPPEEVERVYAEARALVDAAGDVATAAELMISYGNEQLHRGDAEAAADLGAEAVRLCLAAGERELVKRFRLGILLMHTAAGRPRDGLALVDAAGSEWRTRPIDVENYLSRGYYGLMLSWMGRLEESAQTLRAAAAFAETIDRPASWIYGNLVDLANFTGDHRDAMAAANRAMEGARVSGSPFFEALATRAYSLALCLHQRYEEAVTLLESVQPLVAPGAFAHQFEANHHSTLAAAYIGAGRHADGLRMARAAIASGRRSGSRVWEISAWLALLRLPREMERDVAPAEAFERVRELIELTGAVGYEPWLCLARATWSGSPEQRAHWQQHAADGFLRIGAPLQAQRLLQFRAA
jgi:class 3 adenylate cyclase/tetratricopeptide (TPR) repeat protein